MTYLNRNLICEALQELSDESYQRRVWTASSGPEISSFTETVCMLFDDSGLDLALKNGLVYDELTDNRLKAFGALLEKIEPNRTPMEIIKDEKMVEVREIASQILQAVKEQSPS